MCARARYTEFRGEKLATDRASLAAGRLAAETHCGQCHLTPLPESMSQPTAAYMLAYMGLFLGIDASRQLDEAERAHFRQRFELLKSTQQIPSAPHLSAESWRALRGYYLGLARYPFNSTEKVEPLEQAAVTFVDQGVTLIKVLSGGNIAIGGGVTGALFIYDHDLKPVSRISLDSPPVHLEEHAGHWYVLTLDSLLGALGAESQSSIYRIHPQTLATKRVATGLPRAAHFLITDTNADAAPDFIVAGFGSVTGGGLILLESTAGGFREQILSRHSSMVKLALIAQAPKKVEFLALAAGAREELLHYDFEAGQIRERVLETFMPHLGSVGLESADLDDDGNPELLILSGDNADSGPYNEAKPDQGLRIYTFNSRRLKQVHFESLPGALTMHISKNSDVTRIVVARYYADPLSKQDLTVLVQKTPFRFGHRHFSLDSRPTVLAALAQGNDPEYLVGSGNFPILALQHEKPVSRSFGGPVLSRIRPKLATN